MCLVDSFLTGKHPSVRREKKKDYVRVRVCVCPSLTSSYRCHGALSFPARGLCGHPFRDPAQCPQRPGSRLVGWVTRAIVRPNRAEPHRTLSHLTLSPYDSSTSETRSTVRRQAIRIDEERGGNIGYPLPNFPFISMPESWIPPQVIGGFPRVAEQGSLSRPRSSPALGLIGGFGHPGQTSCCSVISSTSSLILPGSLLIAGIAAFRGEIAPGQVDQRRAGPKPLHSLWARGQDTCFFRSPSHLTEGPWLSGWSARSG